MSVPQIPITKHLTYLDQLLSNPQESTLHAKHSTLCNWFDGGSLLAEGKKKESSITFHAAYEIEAVVILLA